MQKQNVLAFIETSDPKLYLQEKLFCFVFQVCITFERGITEHLKKIKIKSTLVIKCAVLMPAW